jgi:hypothetical protein
MNAAKWWMTVGGVLMVIMGGLGLLATHVVGPAPDAILRMNTMHAGAHLLGGLIAIANGLGLTGTARSNATIAYGALFLVAFVVNLASPDLWGMMPDAPANLGIHVMHATVGVLSVVTGILDRPSVSNASRPAVPGSHGI